MWKYRYMYWIFVNCETLSEIRNIRGSKKIISFTYLLLSKIFLWQSYYIIKKGFTSSMAGSKHDDSNGIMSNCGGNQNCKKKFHVIVCKWIPVSVP